MASENEVCLPIPSTGSYLMHLTGKIYTRKAISYFKDFSGKKNRYNGNWDRQRYNKWC